MTGARCCAWTRIAPALIALLLAVPCAAHQQGTSHLSLDLTARSDFTARWDIALVDLELALGLDADGDGAITWGELRRRQPDVAAYALPRLRVATARDDECSLSVSEQAVANRVDGAYAVLTLAGSCPGDARPASLSYRLLFDDDADHRGLLSVRTASGVRSEVLSAAAPDATLRGDAPAAGTTFASHLVSGIEHIAGGFDHLLFVISLLLPCVLRRDGQRWRPRLRARSTAVEVAAIVTAFTVAHSVTLALGALGHIALPARFVESAIAASVIAVALHNLWPTWPRRRWPMAFVLGLVHGLGFAGVLVDSGLPSDTLAIALLGFNLGVEAGQLAMVALLLPVAWWLRTSPAYPNVALRGGSLAIAAVAAIWLLERGLAITVVPT